MRPQSARRLPRSLTSLGHLPISRSPLQNLSCTRRRGLPGLLGLSILIATSIAATTPAASVAPATLDSIALTRSDPFGALVDEALRANLALQGERLAERRSAAQVRQAIGLYLPRVGLDSRLSDGGGLQNLGDLVNPAYGALNQLTGSNTFPTDIDYTVPQLHETRLRVTQPLLAEGIRAGISVARARHDVQRLELGAAARQIAAAVQLAYLQLAAARSVVEIEVATLDVVRENERVAERLVAAGRATPEAVLRARADRTRVEQVLAEARERQLAATREFNRILRRPLEAEVEEVVVAEHDLPIAIEPDVALQHALTYREELLAGDAGIRVAEAARQAVTSRYLPTISAAFDYGFQGQDYEFTSDGDYWMASLVAQWDLVDLGRGPARQAAGFDIERARTARADLEDRIRVEVQNAYEAARVAREAIVTAEAHLEAARRTYQLVQRRYEEGAASPVELVDARTTLTGAELNRALTAYRYAMRWVELERAAALRDISL